MAGAAPPAAGGGAPGAVTGTPCLIGGAAGAPDGVPRPAPGPPGGGAVGVAVGVNPRRASRRARIRSRKPPPAAPAACPADLTASRRPPKLDRRPKLESDPAPLISSSFGSIGSATLSDGKPPRSPVGGGSPPPPPPEVGSGSPRIAASALLSAESKSARPSAVCCSES